MNESRLRVEIWSDVACPWCFIGKRRFETALDGFAHKDSVDVQWRSYQLDPSLPEHYDGTELGYLSERKGMEPGQVAAMFAQVAEQAAGEGLRYAFDDVVVANSFNAHQLLHLARTQGRDAEVKEALLSAHFEQGEDIGSRAFLVRTGAAAGLDPAEIEEALEADTYAASVRQDFAEARSLGISGVPFFVIDRKYGISGAQPADLFARALEEAWAEAHPLTMIGAAGAGTGAAGTDSGAVPAAACGPDGCAI
ncbi:MAG: DsbA family oxidoreductase [Actinomycetales bacterium]